MNAAATTVQVAPMAPHRNAGDDDAPAGLGQVERRRRAPGRFEGVERVEVLQRAADEGDDHAAEEEDEVQSHDGGRASGLQKDGHEQRRRRHGRTGGMIASSGRSMHLIAGAMRPMPGHVRRRALLMSVFCKSRRATPSWDCTFIFFFGGVVVASSAAR